MINSKINNVNDYIKGFPDDIQKILKQIHTTIKRAAPLAEETIKYNIPTYVLQGNLVHFAACKNHIGFYPAPSGIDVFKKQLSAYKGAKGSVQFPLSQPMPLELISQIVEFRVNENLNKAVKKKKS